MMSSAEALFNLQKTVVNNKLTYIDVFLCSFCKSLLTDNFPVSVPFEIQSNIISNCLSMLRYEFRLSIELLRSVYI
jgi:hypothetical protein